MKRFLRAALALAMMISMASIAFAETGSVEVRGHIGDTRAQYHIAYNANGGTGSCNGPEIITGETDTVCSLSQTGITRYNCIFISWNTNVDGNGAQYQAGDSITLDRNVTLYAQWRARAVKQSSKDSSEKTSLSNSEWAPWSNDTTPPQNDNAAPASDGAAASGDHMASSIPSTGDTRDMPLCVSLLFVSLTAMLFLLWAKHQEKRHDAQKP